MKNNSFVSYLHFTNLSHSGNTPSLLLCKIDPTSFTSQFIFGRPAGAPHLLYHTKIRENFSGRQLPENLTFLAYCEIYLCIIRHGLTPNRSVCYSISPGKNDNNNNETSTMRAHTCPFWKTPVYLLSLCCQTEIDAHELDSYPAFVGNNNACNIYTPAPRVCKQTRANFTRASAPLLVIIFPEAAADKRGLIDSNRFVKSAFRRAGIVCCGWASLLLLIDRSGEAAVCHRSNELSNKLERHKFRERVISSN